MAPKLFDDHIIVKEMSKVGAGILSFFDFNALDLFTFLLVAIVRAVPRRERDLALS